MTQPRARADATPALARTVLIVEDDPSIALGLRINLEAEGYRVLSAEDGEKGLLGRADARRRTSSSST